MMFQKMLLQLLCFFFISNIQAQTISIKNNKESVLQAMWSITSAECFEHVNRLASEKFTGRAAGSKGFTEAANYIANEFKEMGLKSANGDSSFFQFFNVSRNKFGQQNKFSMEVLIQSPTSFDTLWVQYQIENDFLPAGFSSSCELVNQVVVAGYGITSPENNWDDYANLDVKDKFVMVLSGAPPINNTNFGRLYRIRNKVKFAKNAGAKGFILIGNPIGLIADNQKMPSVIISEKTADDILKGTAYTVKRLKQEIKQTQQSIALNLIHRVHMAVESQLLTGCQTQNIVGFLEGRDLTLKKEYIVIGAHVDHLGTIGDLIFCGANDNASGTATMLEVAEAFSKLEPPPRRSVIFIAFSGEEMGLLGSEYYTEHPVFLIEKTKAMINLDMVGAGREAIMAVGGRSYPEFADLFESFSDQYIHIPIKRRWTSPISDHYPFHEKGVPSIFLYAMHGPPTYHSSRDKPETLDAEVMESVGRLSFLVLWNLANADKVEFEFIEKTK